MKTIMNLQAKKLELVQHILRVLTGGMKSARLKKKRLKKALLKLIVASLYHMLK